MKSSKTGCIFLNKYVRTPGHSVMARLRLLTFMTDASPLPTCRLFLLDGGKVESRQLLVASATGVGEGSVRNYCRRALTSILSLYDTFIHGPTREKKAAMKQRICAASRGVFGGCVGFINGTFITLQYAPLKDWWYYFNRKSTYALNTMIVCSDQRKILYVKASDTSASHDARFYQNSLLNHHAEDFFDDSEYLLGDTAYPVNDRMVCPFKKPFPMPAHPKANATISSQRIAIEHTFGMLKARFPSITNVSIRIDGAESHKRVVEWFLGACILHNFLRDVDDWEWDDAEDREMAARHQALVEEAQAAHARQAEEDDAVAGGRRRRGAAHVETVRDIIFALFGAWDDL
jgi:hypothetical protein